MSNANTIFAAFFFASVLAAGAHAQTPSDAAFSGDRKITPPVITLELVDTDIRDALRLVARQGDVSLVMSELVLGKVSLELNDATIDEALDAIMRIGGLSHTIEGKIYVVSTVADMLERKKNELEFEKLNNGLAAPQMLLLQLRYVDAERMQPMILALLSETGTATVMATSDHIAMRRDMPSAGGSSGSSSGSESDGGGLSIGSRLSSSTQGQPAKSHTLVVFDVPDRLGAVQELVDRIDIRPAQILIEARFVEVTLDENDRLGVDWNILAGGRGASSPHTFPFGDTTLGKYNPSVSGGSTSGAFPDAPNSVTTPGSPGLFSFGTLDFSTFSAVLEAMETNSNVEVVSSPRVTVGDRRTATILVGERFPILRANISDFGTVTEELERYEPIGVQLEVTPSILGDDEVELYVRPSTSTLGPMVEGSTGLMVARINTRQIDTSVTARDRETVVLGGLITTRESEEFSSVPFLGSIPILGRLFQHRGMRTERIDLVVFLTVTILNDGQLSPADQAMLERGLRATRSTLEPSTSTPQF